MPREANATSDFLQYSDNISDFEQDLIYSSEFNTVSLSDISSFSTATAVIHTLFTSFTHALKLQGVFQDRKYCIIIFLITDTIMKLQ